MASESASCHVRITWDGEDTKEIGQKDNIFQQYLAL